MLQCNCNVSIVSDVFLALYSNVTISILSGVRSVSMISVIGIVSVSNIVL